jgi:hypothetical protein
MTKLGTTATVTRQIITPGQAPLQPFDEFERSQMRKNLDACFDECRYMRQTGRTTRLVIEALEMAVNNPGRYIVILTLDSANVKCINILLHHYITQYGLDEKIRPNIHVCTNGCQHTGKGINILHTLVDNSVTDAQTLKKTVSRPDTKYRACQIVNVVMPEVWIKKIQFAGGDSNAHQYVGQTKNGVEIFFTEDDVMKVVGEID